MGDEDGDALRAFDRLVARLRESVEGVNNARDNRLKRSGAEAEFAKSMDEIRLALQRLLASGSERSGSSRSLSRKSPKLGTEMSMHSMSIRATVSAADLATVRQLCNAIQLPSSSAWRREECLRAIGDVEKILQDSAWVEDLPIAQLVPQTPLAAEALSRAQTFEQFGKIDKAAEEYRRAERSIAVSVAVCRAVMKFKALVGSDAEVSTDMEQLLSVREHVGDRLEVLKEQVSGSNSEIPISPFKTMQSVRSEAEPAAKEMQPPDGTFFEPPAEIGPPERTVSRFSNIRDPQASSYTAEGSKGLLAFEVEAEERHNAADDARTSRTFKIMAVLGCLLGGIFVLSAVYLWSR